MLYVIDLLNPDSEEEDKKKESTKKEEPKERTYMPPRLQIIHIDGTIEDA